MYGFLDQQGGGVACMVKDPCLLPEKLVVSDQACSAITDPSVSSLLVAGWCSCKRISSALFVSPMYFCPQPRFFQCRVSVFDPAQFLRVDGVLKTVLILYFL